MSEEVFTSDEVYFEEDPEIDGHRITEKDYIYDDDKDADFFCYSEKEVVIKPLSEFGAVLTIVLRLNNENLCNFVKHGKKVPKSVKINEENLNDLQECVFESFDEAFSNVFVKNGDKKLRGFVKMKVMDFLRACSTRHEVEYLNEKQWVCFNVVILLALKNHEMFCDFFYDDEKVTSIEFFDEKHVEKFLQEFDISLSQVNSLISSLLDDDV